MELLVPRPNVIIFVSSNCPFGCVYGPDRNVNAASVFNYDAKNTEFSFNRLCNSLVIV